MTKNRTTIKDVKNVLENHGKKDFAGADLTEEDLSGVICK